jgi:ketosteroid isomerase-like protein
VIGNYVGQPLGSEEPMTAAFVHVLAFRDGRIVELRQVTDSQRWSDAAAGVELATINRMFDAVERRDAEALLSAYAEDVVITEADALPYGGPFHGHEGAVQHGRAYVEAWDPLQTPADRLLDRSILHAGERIFVIWHQRGTSSDGERLDQRVIDLIEMRDGKVRSLQMFHSDTAATREFLDQGLSRPPGLG